MTVNEHKIKHTGLQANIPRVHWEERFQRLWLINSPPNTITRKSTVKIQSYIEISILDVDPLPIPTKRKIQTRWDNADPKPNLPKREYQRLNE